QRDAHPGEPGRDRREPAADPQAPERNPAEGRPVAGDCRRMKPACRRVAAIAVATACSGALPNAARAQSLADAARRAEQQHEANKNKDIRSLSNRDLAASDVLGTEPLDLELTPSLIRRWIPVRINVLKAMIANPAMARQVQARAAASARD